MICNASDPDTDSPMGLQNVPSLPVVGTNIAPTTASSINAARKPVQKLSPPSSKRLRSGLLNKLGIVDERLIALPRLDHQSNTVQQQQSMLGPQLRILKAPLKTNSRRKNKQSTTPFADPGLLGVLGSIFKSSGGGSPTSSMDSDDCQDYSSNSTPSSLDDNAESGDGAAAAARRPKLTFNETVSVVHIPTRHEYSKRIKGCLWEPDLQENIMRNTIEFAADGWDWRSVLEEDHHISCPESGELIHPVHCEIARLIRQEQQGLPEQSEDAVMELLNTR